MKYILQLSGEHPSLPQAEVDAVLDAEGIGHTLESHGRHLILDADSDDPSFISRLAYTLQAYEFAGSSCSLQELAGQVFDMVEGAASFRVTSSDSIQKSLGKILHGLGLQVDLKEPEVDICVFSDGELFLAGVKLGIERSYEKRRPQYRPYFHPSSMHPKLARALVNLGRVPVGDAVVDPFCGSGGILIEAGLMGMSVAGFDIDPRMAEGCRQNLRNFGISADIRVCDALEASYRADAIVTDPPYGRSSYTSQEISGLYRKFIETARDCLDCGAYMVLMLPSEHQVRPDRFELKATFDVRVHKSLTRRIWVMEAV